MELQVFFPGDPINLADGLSHILEQLNAAGNRNLSFFNETISCFIILTTASDPPKYTLAKFQDTCQRLTTITADVKLIQQDYKAGRTGTVIRTLNLDKSDVVVTGEKDGTLYTAWMCEFSTSYPKRKLANPCLCISVVAKVHNASSEKVEKDLRHDENLLEGLRVNGVLNPLVLPLSSVMSSAAPLSHEKPKEQPQNPSETASLESEWIYLTASYKTPIYAPINMKLKSTKPAGRDELLLVTLDLGIPKEVVKLHVGLEICTLFLSFRGGSVKSLNSSMLEKFPIKLSPRDNLNFTYRIENEESDTVDGPIKPVTINAEIRMKRFANDGSFQYISNVLHTTWVTGVDFNIAAPPLLNSLHATSSYRSLSQARQFSMSNLQRSQDMKTALRSSSNMALSRSPNISGLQNLELYFSGDTNVKLGQIFKWKLQVINKSTQTLNPSLFIRPSNANYIFEKSMPRVPNNGEDDVNTILPHAQVIKLHSQLRLNSSGIICLNNDVKLGPLEPQSIFETHLEFIGIDRGLFPIQGIRISHRGETFDCGKLLNVLVV